MEKNNKNQSSDNVEINILDPFVNCPGGVLSCINKDNICANAPCKLIQNKFGIHERIIEHYIDLNDYDNAYYYHLDLVHIFNISCELKDNNSKELSPGCKVFAVLDNLHRLKKTIKSYSKYEPIENANISEDGKENYKKAKAQFENIIFSNMKRLGRLVMDVKNERFDKNDAHLKVIEYYEKSFEAARKYGMPVNPPDIFEVAFKKAGELAGTYSEKHAKTNQNRIEKAKEDMARDNLINEIRTQLAENGKLTPELQEKVRELQKKGDIR